MITRSWIGLVAISLACSLASWGQTMQPAQGAAKPPGAAHPYWVGSWAAAPADGPGARPPRRAPGIDNQTVRMIVRVSLGGAVIRLRFSNALGTRPLQLGDVHVARAGTGAAIVSGSDHTVTFSGEKSFEVPPGADVLSDPIAMNVRALARLAVSIYIPNDSGSPATHLLGNQTNYIAGPGDLDASVDLPGARAFTQWYWLDGIEVAADHTSFAVVALGDSITDGYHSTRDSNHRWPDILADQLDGSRGDGPPLGILNEGISGNRILHDAAGPSALARFDRDVLAQPGARMLIVLEGINDIGWTDQSGGYYAGQAVSAGDIIAGLRQIVMRAHAAGMVVVGGTLTPYQGAAYATPAGEAKREAVNAWIRTPGNFDAVVDFAAVTRDPADPQRFLPAYDSGDHLHPNDAGYHAMGEAAAAVVRKLWRR